MAIERGHRSAPWGRDWACDGPEAGQQRGELLQASVVAVRSRWGALATDAVTARESTVLTPCLVAACGGYICERSIADRAVALACRRPADEGSIVRQIFNSLWRLVRCAEAYDWNDDDPLLGEVAPVEPARSLWR